MLTLLYLGAQVKHLLPDVDVQPHDGDGGDDAGQDEEAAAGAHGLHAGLPPHEERAARGSAPLDGEARRVAEGVARRVAQRVARLAALHRLLPGALRQQLVVAGQSAARRARAPLVDAVG